VSGEQYIAVMAGRGFSGGNDEDARARNPGRIFAFKLDGKATLPPGPGPAPPPNPPEFVSASAVTAGAEPYRMYCSRCHGGEAHSLNIIPDLRRSAALTSAALWKNIVIDGAFEPNGMIGWSAFIDAVEAENIRAYVGAQARLLRDAEPAPADAAPPATPAADAL
jgi:quinohemoprotein ethanol dehydrogenase